MTEGILLVVLRSLECWVLMLSASPWGARWCCILCSVSQEFSPAGWVLVLKVRDLGPGPGWSCSRTASWDPG